MLFLFGVVDLVLLNIEREMLLHFVIVAIDVPLKYTLY